MASKKQAAKKFLVRATAEAEWSVQGAPGADDGRGVFRAFVDTDLAKVVIHIGPGYLEEWNPAPLASYSMKYLRGGSHLRVAFELPAPLHWKGELELSVFGGLAGRFDGAGGRQGRITGRCSVEEERDHVHEAPRPTRALAEKLQAEPKGVMWKPPACCDAGAAVLLVGIAGPSRSGKSTLAKALLERLCGCGRQVVVVEQSRYEVCAGSYACSAGVNESMYENPSAVNWAALVKGLDKAIESVSTGSTAQKQGIVFLDGTLVLWMPQICQALHRRLFLRASRSLVLQRRQFAAPLAEPFVEHVFWPMHLQYGQPPAPWEELAIRDEAGYPPPEDLVAEALGALGLGEEAAVA